MPGPSLNLRGAGRSSRLWSFPTPARWYISPRLGILLSFMSCFPRSRARAIIRTESFGLIDHGDLVIVAAQAKRLGRARTNTAVDWRRAAD